MVTSDKEEASSDRRAAMTRPIPRKVLLGRIWSPSPRRVAEGARLTAVIAGRIAAVLPPGEFELKVTDTLISIDGVGSRQGNGYSTAPALMWYLPFPASHRLKLIFEAQARDLQRFLSQVRRSPWPSEGARQHVDVTPRAIHVWWGGSCEADAVTSMRVILREELGL